MPATLTVSIPPESHSFALDASGRGEATFILTNSTAKPVQGRGTVVPQEPASRDWFRIVGSQERSFRGAETHQFKVEVAVPPETPAGKYGFRLDALNVANPDEDFAEGQTILFAWKPAAVAAPARRPGWIIPAIIGACATLLVVGLGLAFLLRDTNVTVPNVLGKARADAESDLKAAGLKLSETPSFGFDSSKDLDAVLELSSLQDGTAKKLDVGARLRKGTLVVLTLNKFMTIPELEKMNIEKALKILKDANIPVALPVEERLEKDKPAATVLSMEPTKIPSPWDGKVKLTANRGFIEVKHSMAVNEAGGSLIQNYFVVTYRLPDGSGASKRSKPIGLQRSELVEIPVGATNVSLQIFARNIGDGKEFPMIVKTPTENGKTVRIAAPFRREFQTQGDGRDQFSFARDLEAYRE